MSSVPAPSRPPSTGQGLHAEEGRRFLQERLTKYAGFITVLGAGIVLGRLTLLTSTGHLDVVPLPSHALLVTATLCMAALYLFARHGSPSVRAMHGAEAFGLVGAGVSLDILGYLLSTELLAGQAVAHLASDPDEVMALVLARTAPLTIASFVQAHALVLRAAFVPDTPWRTAILTATIGVPAALFGALTGLPADEVDILWLQPGFLAAAGVVQWGLTTVICAAVSQVVYGLRREVEEARRLGQYTLEELIGEGGMGLVYRARHALLRRPTAVKLLIPEKTGQRSLERFEREVQLTAQLTHPNTITIYDYGRTAQGQVYYAMELLDGATLEEIVELDGPQPAGRVVRILAQVAGALGEAHEAGLVHRDVKPSNVVLSRQGGELDVAKVVDFGLVKELEGPASTTLSAETTLAGTPLYMAPEMILGPSRPDPRSDLYALGAVGYYLLTGTHVFSGTSVIEVLGHHMHTEPEPPSLRLGDELPADLEALVLELLAKDPRERPQTGYDVRTRVEACQSFGRWTGRAAQRWWSTQGERLRGAGATVGPQGSATLEVDVDRRD
ncbi:MAG: serine/threonine-protein kinase [Sandaracinaceae bacterium]